jgi:hypothetical protein
VRGNVPKVLFFQIPTGWHGGLAQPPNLKSTAAPLQLFPFKQCAVEGREKSETEAGYSVD